MVKCYDGVKMIKNIYESNEFNLYTKTNIIWIIIK